MNKTVTVWDVLLHSEKWSQEVGSAIRDLDISSDSTKIVTGKNDGTITVWNAGNGSELRTFSFTNEVHSVAFDPQQNRFAAGCKNGAFQLWSAMNDWVITNGE
ncbi:MAG: hypothetical protein JXR87_06910 [Candidatus Marinimicrobia bacterium]|nr:hypothetical protein [Candidatus Neomarinimicrobiota bacterium]